jgi:cupin fold WbuC family metalloprotein
MNILEQKFNLNVEGLTPAYFSLSRNECISSRHIDALRTELIRCGGTVHRICLHMSSNEEFHNMIIAQKREGGALPHMHPNSAESYHIIDGSIRVSYYDLQGAKVKDLMLSVDSNIIARVDSGVYHSIEPISEISIYHESKSGPFDRDKDYICAEWNES